MNHKTRQSYFTFFFIHSEGALSICQKVVDRISQMTLLFQLGYHIYSKSSKLKHERIGNSLLENLIGINGMVI